jgi:hypothetical protein
MATEDGQLSTDQPIWNRIAGGHATVVIGGALPPAPPGRAVVMVPCDRPQRDLGAILDARRRIERRIGQASSFWELAADRVRSSIRRRVLADEPEPERAWMLVEPLNRLQEESDVPAALVFDIVEAADPASIALLEEVVGHPGRAGAALVFVVRTEAEGAAKRLVQAVRRVEGKRRVLDVRGALVAATGPMPLVKPVRRKPTWSIDDLPRDLRRVARAAAIVGDVFESELVAGLLRVDELHVLEALQDLSDRGAPITDLGDGAFQIDGPSASVMRADVQASLAVAWNLRLAELLGAASNLTITTEVPAVGAIPDPARAAAHLEAAGEANHAATGFLHAAREAMALGADDQAKEHARRALEILVGVVGPRGRAMKAEATMLEAFLGGDQEDLGRAVEGMAAAQRALAQVDPASAAELAHTERLLDRLTRPSTPKSTE